MDKHRKACTESAWPTWPWPIGKRKRSLNKNMKSSHRVPVTQDSGPSSAISSQLASQRRHLVFLLHFDKRTSESFVEDVFGMERSEVIHLACFRDSSHQEPRGLQQNTTTTQPKRRESRPSARITCSNSRRDSLLLSLCFVQEMLAVQPPPDMSVQYHHLHREWKCLNMLEHNNANKYVNTEAIHCWFKTSGTWTHGRKTGILGSPKISFVDLSLHSRSLIAREAHFAKALHWGFLSTGSAADVEKLACETMWDLLYGLPQAKSQINRRSLNLHTENFLVLGSFTFLWPKWNHS